LFAIGDAVLQQVLDQIDILKFGASQLPDPHLGGVRTSLMILKEEVYMEPELDAL
jgi:hypothetical protein